MTFFIVTFVLMMNIVWRFIEDLTGKGLSADVIFELIFYATLNMIPLGLPLAMLLAGIMTMGNMGENFELQAMKSAGMSLMRIMQPLIIVTVIISISSFFLVNNVVPYAYKRSMIIMTDIQRQKQVLEFKDGLFFNGIDEDMSIRVEHQDPETAYILANAIANTAPAYMSEIVVGSSMKIIDYPMYSDKRYKPNYIRYSLLGFLLGAVLVIIKVIVSTLTDDKVKSVQDIEDRFSLPILGVIPDVLESTDEKGKGYYAYEYSERSSSKDKDGKQGEK